MEDPSGRYRLRLDALAEIAVRGEEGGEYFDGFDYSGESVRTVMSYL